MRLHRFAMTLACASLITVSPTVGATAQRTFVASTGSDANTCALTQPCRSFGRAISQTSAGGEVIVLDSAGYGPVTINQSVSIIAPAGLYAGITVSSGNGIAINAPGAIVVLHGLAINGQGGDNGILVTDADTVRVESCTISHLFDAVLARKGALYVQDSIIRNNTSTGIQIFSQNADMVATIGNSTVADNGTGVLATASAGTRITVTVSRSTISGNADGLHTRAPPSAISAILSDRNTIVESSKAFFFEGAGGTELIYTPGNNTAGYYDTSVYNGSLTPCCAI
jgi:hypothetical protein